MEIRKLEYNFPKILTEGEKFADDINNVYPIGDADQVKESAKALKSNDFGIYNDKEKFLIVSRIVGEGEELKIVSDIDKDIKSFFGGDMKEYTQDEVTKMIASTKEEAQEIFDAKLDEMKAAMEADMDKDSEHQKLNDSITEKDEVISKLENEKKELDDKIVESDKKNKQLESGIRNRDRAMKLVEAFEKVGIDNELKKTRIASIASVAEDYDDDKFDEYVKSEVDFINKTFAKASVTDPNDLTTAGTNLPNQDGGKQFTTKQKLEKIMGKK